MNLLTGESTLQLWQQVLTHAQQHCSVKLDQPIEQYLMTLLIRYTNQPDITAQVFATSFLEAMQNQVNQRNHSLQQVGDQCLIYAGLFPHATKRRLVDIGYFVDLGRSAYSAISGRTSELYTSLALEFVMLMDVLQSIRPDDLSPYDAYQQWRLSGSQQALRLLQRYCGVIVPFTGPSTGNF